MAKSISAHALLLPTRRLQLYTVEINIIHVELADRYHPALVNIDSATHSRHTNPLNPIDHEAASRPAHVKASPIDICVQGRINHSARRCLCCC